MCDKTYRVCSSCESLVYGSPDHVCDKCGNKESILIEIAWTKKQKQVESLQNQYEFMQKVRADLLTEKNDFLLTIAKLNKEIDKNDKLAEAEAEIASLKEELEDQWIDIGIETRLGGQATHVWLKPKDVRPYIEELRKKPKQVKDMLDSVISLLFRLEIIAASKASYFKSGDWPSILKDIQEQRAKISQFNQVVVQESKQPVEDCSTCRWNHKRTGFRNRTLHCPKCLKNGSRHINWEQG